MRIAKQTARVRAPLSSVAATALVVVAIVLAGCGGGAPASERTGSEPGGAAVESEGTAHRAPARLREALALFRREATARDTLPPRLVPPPQAVNRLTLDLAASRLAYQGAFSRIYAVPGPRAVCLFDTRGASSTCWPPATVADGKAVNTTFCPPSLPPRTMQMVGLLPDGIRRVWVVREDGRRLSAPVSRNLFILDVPFERSLPDRLIWRRGGEVHNQTAGIDPRFARMACWGRGPSY